MKRWGSLAIVITCLLAISCQMAPSPSITNTPTETSTATAAPTHPPASATPRPPTATATPVPMTATPSSTPTRVSPPSTQLLEELRKTIPQSRQFKSDVALWEERYATDSKILQKRRDDFSGWVRGWLGEYLSSETDLELQLNDYQVPYSRLDGQETTGNPNYELSEITILGRLRLRPAIGCQSLWCQDGELTDLDGWTEQSFSFVFARQGETFDLVEIYRYQPFYYSRVYDSADFDGLSEEEQVAQLVAKWLEAYVSDDVEPRFRLFSYSVDSVELYAVENQQSRYFVHFSVDTFQTNAVYWTHTFSGLSPDWETTEIINNARRYVGITVSDDLILFETLDRSGPSASDYYVYYSELETSNPEEIGFLMMEKFMRGSTGPDVTSCGQLTDYRVDDVQFSRAREEYICLYVGFSVKLAQRDCGFGPNLSWNLTSLNPETGWYVGGGGLTIRDTGSYYELDWLGSGGRSACVAPEDLP